jgi:hypothetical protein
MEPNGGTATLGHVDEPDALAPEGPVETAPTPGERFAPVSPAHPLDDVLRQVNQLRAELGADPIYELPKAQSAMDAGSDCVLERAFEDLEVACVDYRFIVGRGYRLEHGLGSFIKRFDDGRYPQLVADSRAPQIGTLS